MAVWSGKGMSEWQKVRLGNIGRVVTGKTPSHKNPKDFGTSMPFLTPTDVKNERTTTSIRGLSEEGKARFHKMIVPAGSTAVVCIGATIGKITQLGEPTLTNQQINSIVPNEDFDKDFIYYLLKLKSPNLISLAGGAATPIINKSTFEKIEVNIPKEVGQQKRIAGILGAYDDLIENNQKRIKILEETAQRLYNEWFVKFRFPGHEKVKLLDSPLGSIPESWEIRTFDDILSELESGSRPRGGVGDLKTGLASVGAENINGIGKHNYSSEKYISPAFYSKMKRGKVKNLDVAIYKDGAYIGRSSFFRDGFPHSEFAVNEHVFLIRFKSKLYANYLYTWLQNPKNVEDIRASNTNAAQPGLNQQLIRSYKLVMPGLDTLERFHKQSDVVYAEIISLAKRNRELQKTRNLLLPKLMSGDNNG